MQRAGGGADLVVDEINVAFVRIARFIGQAEIDRQPAPCSRAEWYLPSRISCRTRQHRRLVHIEVHVHRVLGNDGGQQRLVGDDQVAARYKRASDEAADGRSRLGPFEVELRLSDAGPGGVHRGLGDVALRRAACCTSSRADGLAALERRRFR